jgi:hypothetical protein
LEEQRMKTSFESLESRVLLHGDRPQQSGGGAFEQGNGLLAQYYRDAQFADLAVSRTDPTVNFHWGRRSPAPRKVERNAFAVRWSGQVVPHTSGLYTFRVKADDGVCAWLDGRSVVERMYARGGAVTNTFSAPLAAGQRYDLRIDYCDRSGNAGVKLTWAAPGVRRQVIPQAQLFAAEPTPTPLPLEPAAEASAPTVNWTEVAPLPVPRSEHMGAVVNGKLYVFGGYVDTTFKPTRRTDVYDPATNTWARVADMPVGSTHAGTVVDGNSVYFAGGYPETATFQTYATTAVWRYDTVADAFTSMPALPVGRGGGALALLGRELHYFGGSDAARADAADHWTLNLDDLPAGWVTKAPLPLARNHVGGVALGGKIYAVGGQQGQNDQSVFRDEMDVYDPATNAWSAAAPLPAPPRSHITNGTIIWNGQILTFGGERSGHNVITDISCYDPAQNLWGTPFNLPAGRLSGVADLLPDGRFIYCGGSSSAGLQSNVWIGQVG